ncbi:MAG: FHA-domain-containing protein, partial [uncultured Frankineae bacterium]
TCALPICPRGHHDRARRRSRHARPRRRLDARPDRRLREHPARPPGAGRRRLARRGPRVDERHLPRCREGRPADAGPARAADPRRQDRARAAPV